MAPERSSVTLDDWRRTHARLRALEAAVEALRAEVAELRSRVSPLDDLVTPKQLAAEGLVKFGTLRDYLLDRQRNGLAKHVSRAPQGRKLYISRKGFSEWLKQRAR